MPSGEARGHRVLVLTPSGRDAEMVCARLAAAGIGCEVCPDIGALLAAMAAGAGAALVASEALVRGGPDTLLAALDAQEPWSDLPVLLLTDPPRTARANSRLALAVLERANVTLLERPLRPELLLSSVRAALRARRRQYQTRDLLRQLERAVQLSDMFVSILGHDLRTPLGAIRLAGEVLLRLPDRRAERSAARVLASTDRMTRMIDQLLDFARVRQGRGIPIEPRAASAEDVCRTVVAEIEDAHPRSRVDLACRGELAGEWDPDRLAQVISNLVANAVQHGVGDAPVRLELDGTAAEAVRIRVHNEGCVPPGLLPSLFDAFETTATSGDNGGRRGGLGLGLFIAREIVRTHGGEITVASSEAAGTTFEVRLPRRSGSRPAS